MAIEKADINDGTLSERLLEIWGRSVRATHDFLTEDDIARIRLQAKEAFHGIPQLYTFVEDGTVVAFMGIGVHELEMLFVHPDRFGKGIGRRLLTYAVGVCGVDELYVNEQNPAAIGFYIRCGFEVAGRRECDDMGNPFPLLLMKLKRE